MRRRSFWRSSLTGLVLGRVVLAVLLVKPTDLSGSYGKPIPRKWRYYCETEGCTTEDILRSEQLHKRPRCLNGHGPMAEQSPRMPST
jgi:hypothetical protein